MAIAYPSPLPYVILLVVCLVVIVASFAKFASLRNLRKKRNLLIYPILALLVSLIAYQTYDVSLGPAVVGYHLDNGGNQFYAGQVNQFNLSCSSLGARGASFYLVLNSVNASWVVDSQQNIVQVNSTMIKIPFTFNSPHEMESRQVQFMINDNVADCEFYPSLEQSKDSHVIVSSCTTEVRCVWNETTSSYTANFGFVTA